MWGLRQSTSVAIFGQTTLLTKTWWVIWQKSVSVSTPPQKQWSALNRTLHARTSHHLNKWNFNDSRACGCGHPEQSIRQIVNECHRRKFDEWFMAIHWTTHSAVTWLSNSDLDLWAVICHTQDEVRLDHTFHVSIGRLKVTSEQNQISVNTHTVHCSKGLISEDSEKIKTLLLRNRCGLFQVKTLLSRARKMAD